jgi:AcrR family transcriptional regulator
MAIGERKANGARGTVTKEAITAAALAQIDVRGAAAFSMRQLATDLGVTTMAPYWHARNRQEVLDWVVELVLEKVEVAPPLTGTWAEKIEELLAGVRTRFLEHPNVVDLLRGRYVPAFVRVSNELILLITEGGFTGEDRVLAFGVLMTHFEGSLLIARTTNGFPQPADESRSVEAKSWIAPDRIDPSVEGDFRSFDLPQDEQFRAGIRLLLDGMVARSRS